MLVFLLASLCIGGLLGSSKAASMHQMLENGAPEVQGPLTVELVTDSSQGSYGEQAFARVPLESGVKAIVQVSFSDDAAHLRGEVLEVDASFKPADYLRDENLWKNGAMGRLSCRREDRQESASPLGALYDIRARAIGGIGSQDDARTLLQALICGYRRNISGTELYSRFQQCGLAHLVAVSGAHLVIVTGLFVALLRQLRIGRRARIGVSMCLMACYVVLAGVPLSALRAALMSSVGMTSYFGSRRSSSQNALGIVLFAVIAHDPTCSVSLSFVLSALSTAGIILFAPLVGYWLKATPLGSVRFASEALSLTLSSGILSQLYACSVFKLLPIIGPIANIACAPLFPLSCALGLLAAIASSASVPGSTLLLSVASLPASLLAGLVELLSSVPFATIPVSVNSAVALVASFALATVLWLAWPVSPSVRKLLPAVAASVAICAVLAVQVRFEDAVYMLDVGQGDAFLVRSRGQTMLIDTGNQDAQLLSQLAECAAFHIDSILITHADDDHCGSLDAIGKGIDVDRVIVFDELLETAEEAPARLISNARKVAKEVVGVKVGDAFEVGAFSALAVWPLSLAEGGGNADSLCVLLSYDGDDDGRDDFTCLFTGDAEKEQLAEMLAMKRVSDIDVLKVGHHGSKNAMTEDEARALAPELALISVGAGNRYGHPAAETLDILDMVGCTTFRTDVDSRVKLCFSPSSIVVQ